MTDQIVPQWTQAFVLDGSLRDVYIQETTKHDWQLFVDFLRSDRYALEFLVAGELRPLPEQVEDIFALTEDGTLNLHIDEEHMALHCHFISLEEIDLDLDPKPFQDHSPLILRLLDFLRTIGKILGKEVILAPENMSYLPYFRYDPRAEHEAWLW